MELHCRFDENWIRRDYDYHVVELNHQDFLFEDFLAVVLLSLQKNTMALHVQLEEI